jgi:hypothetical protein
MFSMVKRSENLKSIFLIFSIFVFILIPFINAYDLKIPTNTTACNVTISFQNSTNLINNAIMDKSATTGYANYSFNPPTQGDYYYYSNCGSGTFNPNGETLTTSKGLLYFLVTLFAFGIFFLISWIFLNINGENPKDETGYLGINYRKYLKTSLFPLVYVTFLWFFNFIIGLSSNYLGLTLYSNTLEFIFIILTKLTYPIIAVTFIVLIVLMVKDSNIKKEYQSLWTRF